ncbi:MAG: methyltransferase domain-containing protein [Bradyrhizobium sp.]|nr:methyltransferase domain-containing protein [Bradyrhizobium sp.]
MKQLIRSALASAGMLQQVEHKRRRGLESALIASHLTSQGPHKLHIGCGFNVLPGWLNTDYYPTAPDIAHLDATKPFPFEDATFDFVFSEHMIEHIPYPDGCNMLRECCRVLKPGGVVRISTPNLSFLIELYGGKTDQQRQYIEWSKQNFIPWAAEANDTFVINNFMHDWGHCFIYDEKALRQAMGNAGLRDIVRCEIQKSSKTELRDLENEQRAPAGFLRLETLTMEGTR